MLKSKISLRKKKDFEEIIKHGRSLYNPLVRIRFIENNLPESRFSVVTSTKISKKAVIRNRIRRQISALLRTNWKIFIQGYDLMFIVQPGWLQQPTKKVRENFLAVLTKQKMLKAK